MLLDKSNMPEILHLQGLKTAGKWLQKEDGIL
jgi:hypothetical protein